MLSRATQPSAADSVASYFNGAVAASAICAADEIGLLELIRDIGPLAPDYIAASLGVHPTALGAVLRALRSARVVDQRDGLVSAGETFCQVLQDKGYFTWLLRGYGRFLSHAAELSLVERGAEEVRSQRDLVAIARAGRDYGAAHVDEIFRRLIQNVDFARGLDLGCGSGGRLIQLAREYPGRKFIGVEVDPAVVHTAAHSVRDAGVGDAVQLLCADARNLPVDDSLREVDLVFSFFMGHDFWPRAEAVRVLTALAYSLPKAQRFLLSDTCGRAADPEASWPVFTLGFDYTHGLMRQYLPTLEEWRAFFAETPWLLTDVHRLGIADSYIFDLVRRCS